LLQNWVRLALHHQILEGVLMERKLGYTVPFYFPNMFTMTFFYLGIKKGVEQNSTPLRDKTS
jgi:hypothetical protein